MYYPSVMLAYQVKFHLLKILSTEQSGYVRILKHSNKALKWIGCLFVLYYIFTLNNFIINFT